MFAGSTTPSRYLDSALIVTVPSDEFVIEQAWPIPSGDKGARGVVAEGPVATQLARSLRFLRYEVRRWRDGFVADIEEAVESPRRLTEDVDAAERLLEFRLGGRETPPRYGGGFPTLRGGRPPRGGGPRG